MAQIVYYDHRGHGRSDPRPQDEWTLDTWADDIVRLARAKQRRVAAYLIFSDRSLIEMADRKPRNADCDIHAILKKAGIPVTRSVKRLARSMQVLADFHDAKQRRPEPITGPAIPANVLDGWSGTMNEHAAKLLLKACGIPVSDDILFPPAPISAHLAQACRFPAALKIVSADIAHKSDIGGPVPGSCSGQAKETFNEGLHLPAVGEMTRYPSHVQAVSEAATTLSAWRSSRCSARSCRWRSGCSTRPRPCPAPAPRSWG